MRNLRQIFSYLFFLVLTGCPMGDPSTTIKYEILNNTDRLIKVKYSFVFGKSSNTAQETTIDPNSKKVIDSILKLGTAKYFDQRKDSIMLYSLTIEQDSLRTTQNFKDKKYWTFKTNGELEGTYQLTVDNQLLK